MYMYCYDRVRATDITITNGISKITIPTTTPNINKCLWIDLRVAIPLGTSCTRVQIVNGSDTLDVEVTDGNYWRPCELRCRSILVLQYFDDPAHYVIRDVKGNGCM